MITEYLQSALKKAHYEFEDGTYFAEIPNFETERISTTFGIPDIATSTGKVIWRSISKGASDGAPVKT